MATIDRAVVPAALIGVLLLNVGAYAAEQGITGKKLLLKSNPKMVLLSKDALVVPGANGNSSDPRCVADGGSGSGASAALSDGTNSATLTMPCANWSANGAGTLYKYKDAAGTPKVGKIKAGLLKVVSPGMGGFPVPNGAATVSVEVTVGTDKYCMTFTGTGDGDKFLVKDAALGSCAPSQTCGNGVREGTEACDGIDAAACPGECLGDCTCPPPPVSFASTVQPIFSANCASSICHSGPSAQANLNLEPGMAYGNIVNVASFEMPAVKRVLPGDALNSYLYQKITNAMGISGAPMPTGSYPMPSADIDTIEAWINQGALNN